MQKVSQRAQATLLNLHNRRSARAPVTDTGRSRPRAWAHPSASLPMPPMRLEVHVCAFCWNNCSLWFDVEVTVPTDSDLPFVSFRSLSIQTAFSVHKVG